MRMTITVFPQDSPYTFKSNLPALIVLTESSPGLPQDYIYLLSDAGLIRWALWFMNLLTLLDRSLMRHLGGENDID